MCLSPGVPSPQYTAGPGKRAPSLYLEEKGFSISDYLGIKGSVITLFLSH